MLKKLRLKLIIINMAIVTIMLCLIFITLYSSTSQNLERDSITMMRSISRDPMGLGFSAKISGNVRIPHFVVFTDKNGNFISASGDMYAITR